MRETVLIPRALQVVHLATSRARALYAAFHHAPAIETLDAALASFAATMGAEVAVTHTGLHFRAFSRMPLFERCERMRERSLLRLCSC